MIWHRQAEVQNERCIENIKNRATVQKIHDSEEEPDPNKGAGLGKVRSNVQSTKLREILNSMGNDEV